MSNKNRPPQSGVNRYNVYSPLTPVVTAMATAGRERETEKSRVRTRPLDFSANLMHRGGYTAWRRQELPAIAANEHWPRTCDVGKMSANT